MSRPPAAPSSNGWKARRCRGSRRWKPDRIAAGWRGPAGSFDQLADPQSRAKVTQLLTLHILPGEVRAADITKAIENSKGKATLMTMSGATLTATQEGGKIVLTDASGGKATISKADDRFSNGVVHHIDILLTPSKSGGPAQ